MRGFLDPRRPASPRSMRLTVWRDKSAVSANFCWVQQEFPAIFDCAAVMRCAEVLIVMGASRSMEFCFAKTRCTRSVVVT
jgi:hypothetical protein